MILIVGATSKLGRVVARLLLAEGKPVRAMTRTPDLADDLKNLGAEVVRGDLCEPASLEKACHGVERVLAAAHAFTGKGNNNPKTVDGAGNRHLIDSARAAGVHHFVFTSAHGAHPDHPVDFFRIKYEVEEYVKISDLSYTILRPSAFMETWAMIIGQPIIERGKAMIFGRGKNPINFVSVEDVAQIATLALEDPTARNQVIEIGGPENLTLEQVAETFERVLGFKAKKNHIPLSVMRIMRIVLRLPNPVLSRQIAAGVYMDTAHEAIDVNDTLKGYPLRRRRLEEVVQKLYAQSEL